MHTASEVLPVECRSGELSGCHADLLCAPYFEDDGNDDLRELDAATAGAIGRARASGELTGKLHELSPQNRSMVEAARSLGATAKFAGSGGAIMGTYRDEEHYEKLRGGLARLGIRTIRPVI